MVVLKFVSIDVEGLDEEIVGAFDFAKYLPDVFCIETAYYRHEGSDGKNLSIIQLMHDNGYIMYADTYVNTILVDGEK